MATTAANATSSAFQQLLTNAGSNGLGPSGLLAYGGLTTRALSDFIGDRMDFASLGGKADAYSWLDGTQAQGSSTITSASLVVGTCDAGGCTDQFGQPIAAKYICNTGAGNASTPNGPQGTAITLCGQVTSVSPPHTLTASFTAANATPAYGIANATVVTNGAYGYAPGDLLYISGVSGQQIQAAQKIIDTMVVSATVVAGGSGALSGGSGQCMVIGTTGTLRKQKNINYVEAVVNVTSGAMTSVASIYNAGDYTTNPNSSTPGNVVPEPVTASPVINGQPAPCTGLTGGTVALYMGVLVTSTTTGGQRNGIKPNLYGSYYPSVTAGTYPTTTNGSGDGSLTLSVSGDFQVGGQITEYTDNTAAYNSAVGLINAARTLGVGAVLYLAPGQCSTASATTCTVSRTGAYGFGGSSATPTIAFTKGGGIIGDGKEATRLYFSPLYPAAPMIWFDGYPLLVDKPFDAITLSFSKSWTQIVHHIEIDSDRTGPANGSIALGICGSSYWGEYSDIDVHSQPGDGIDFGCLGGSDTYSHNRESRFRDIRLFEGGNTGHAAFSINGIRSGSIGNGEIDDVGVENMEIFGPHGVGILVHASTSNGGIGFVNFTGRLRLEGEAPDGFGLQGDLIQVGDNNSSWCGQVHDIHFPSGIQFIDPYQGFFAFHTISCSTANNQIPENITIDGEGASIGGGSPLGGGFAFDYCSLCVLHVTYSNALGYDYQQGSAAATGNQPMTLYVAPGQISSWATNIDPTGLIQEPAMVQCTGSICSASAASYSTGTSYLTAFEAALAPVTLGDWSVVFDPSTTAYEWTMGNLTCFSYYAKFTPTFTTASGLLQFPLPAAPNIYGHMSYPISIQSPGLAWPNSASAIQFTLQPNQLYGLVDFQKSGSSIPSTGLNVGSGAGFVNSGTQYVFSAGGRYN